jgi:Ser/Thr protein kinase RdoA (MazF antagonist)
LATNKTNIFGAGYLEVENLLGAYDFSEKAKISFLAESENTIYLVEDSLRASNYVLRVNSGRLGYHTPTSIASEMMWLISLRSDSNILVPKVLPAKDGLLVQTIRTGNLNRPQHAVAYSFLPGIKPLENDLISSFNRLGELSAHLHLHAKDWKLPENFVRHSWTPDTILDDNFGLGPWQIGVNVEGDVLALFWQLENVIRKWLEQIPTDRDNFGLIHSDLTLANILVDGDTHGIIDFDDCGFGWFLSDLTGALTLLAERSDVPQLISSWLAGYQKASQIPDGGEVAIPTLMMLRRLQLIGWLGAQQQHLEFARNVGARVTVDSYLLAKNYLQRFG